MEQTNVNRHSMTHHGANRSRFIQGFFEFLMNLDTPSAILHGADCGFEGPISDVDFVLNHVDFERLPGLLAHYCANVGWLFCQILRHETTAAYLVCCDAEDPSCVVALDACSDYQRNGVVFLSAEELLEGRKTLAWGGHSPQEGRQLCYRFAKAAAKRKCEIESVREFSDYSPGAKNECAAWLENRFRIHLETWTPEGVSGALTSLSTLCRNHPSILYRGSFQRILKRIFQPTGMVLVTGPENFETYGRSLENVFGDVFFRRFRKASRWNVRFVRDLISSTLIVVPELQPIWNGLLPKKCVFDATGFASIDSLQKSLATWLSRRRADHIF